MHLHLCGVNPLLENNFKKRLLLACHKTAYEMNIRQKCIHPIGCGTLKHHDKYIAYLVACPL
jgi:hypothetical protein